MSRSFFYVTRKNPKNVTRKLALRKVSLCLSVSIHWLVGLSGGLADRLGDPLHVYMCTCTFTRLSVACRSPPHPIIPTKTQYDPVVRKHVLFTEAKLK